MPKQVFLSQKKFTGTYPKRRTIINKINDNITTFNFRNLHLTCQWIRIIKVDKIQETSFKPSEMY